MNTDCLLFVIDSEPFFLRIYFQLSIFRFRLEDPDRLIAFSFHLHSFETSHIQYSRLAIGMAADIEQVAGKLLGGIVEAFFTGKYLTYKMAHLIELQIAR